MAEPFIGEIRLGGYNFAPRGWANCEGQLLPIAQYNALFAILGTTYGGDGRTTFGLPDMRSRVPVHVGAALRQGQTGGAETVILAEAQIPQHTHSVPAAAADGAATSPNGAVAAKSREPRYAAAGAATSMPADSVLPTGGGQPHDNIGPVLVSRFIIALQGIFPPRN